MITNTMTPAEIDAEITKDWSELAHADDKFRANGGFKHTRSAKKYPVSVIYEHTTSRNNRYLMLHVIASKKEAMLGNGALFIRALINTEGGMAMCMQNFAERDHKRTIFFLSPHVFSRYKERMGLTFDGVELIRYFCKRNTFFVHMESYRRTKKNTEDVMVSCYDGALFGKKFEDGEVTVMDMRTFVANDTMQEGGKARYNKEFNASIRARAWRAQFDYKQAQLMIHTARFRKEDK